MTAWLKACVVLEHSNTRAMGSSAITGMDVLKSDLDNNLNFNNLKFKVDLDNRLMINNFRFKFDVEEQFCYRVQSSI